MSDEKGRSPASWSEWITTGVLVAAAAAVVATHVAARVPSSSTASSIPAPAEPVLLRGASEGASAAPVVVLEFSDFQCPYCGQFARRTLPALRAKYVAAGKVRLVFEHFPLEAIHPLALGSAVLAECARRQGTFWTVHDALFANQPGLGGLVADPGTAFALDGPALSACLGSGQATADVREDAAAAKRLGVTGTPAFFIGTPLGPDRLQVHNVLVGAVTEATLSKAIDSLVAKKH